MEEGYTADNILPMALNSLRINVCPFRAHGSQKTECSDKHT